MTHARARRTARLRGASILALAILAAAVPLTVVPRALPAWAAAADGTAGEPSWSVATVDGDQGTGRANYSYALGANGELTDAIRVKNTGTQPLQLQVYAADAFTTAEGSIDILTQGATSEDAGSWITPETREIQLQPGEAKDVKFTVRVPATAAPGDHSAAIVASLAPADDAQVRVERRLGLRVSIRVPGITTANLAVKDVHADYLSHLNPLTPASVRVSYTVTNTGNARVRVDDAVATQGLFAFGSPNGGTAIEDLLPGSSVQVVREVPTLATGSTNVAVRVAAVPLDGQIPVPTPVEAKDAVVGAPWSLGIALLLLIAGGTVTALVLVRRRRNYLYLMHLRNERDGVQPGAHASSATPAPTDFQEGLV